MSASAKKGKRKRTLLETLAGVQVCEAANRQTGGWMLSSFVSLCHGFRFERVTEWAAGSPPRTAAVCRPLTAAWHARAAVARHVFATDCRIRPPNQKTLMIGTKVLRTPPPP